MSEQEANPNPPVPAPDSLTATGVMVFSDSTATRLNEQIANFIQYWQGVINIISVSSTSGWNQSLNSFEIIITLAYSISTTTNQSSPPPNGTSQKD